MTRTTTSRPLRALACTALLPLLALALPGSAQAASSGYGSEYLSTGEFAEPNVLFVIDRSVDMASPCDSSGTEACIDVVIDAISKVTQHYDWARYGVVGTADSVGSDDYLEIAPLGSTAVEINTALSSVSATSLDVRNLAEVLEKLGQQYFPITTTPDDTDDDGDGIVADWDEAPIVYDCQTTHVIVIAADRPQADNQVTGTWSTSISPDVTCNSAGITTDGSDTLCDYDNVAYKLFSSDLNGALSGTQNVTVHTVSIDVGSSSVAEHLFGNASDVTGGVGIYNHAATGDEVLSSILTVMQDIRTGTYSRSTPIVTASGDRLIYSFYELTGDNPLAEGHIRAYEIEDDPLDPDYGDIVLDATSSYGGALWDGGNLLLSRPVPGSEYNPDDMDGVGYRDIYTFFEEASALGGLSSESLTDRRQPLDRQFVTVVGASTPVLDDILDTDIYTSLACTAGVGTFSVYDINEDCSVDSLDLQEMVDFLRGRPDATFRYLAQERGYWKLGDAPYGVPAVVEPRLNNQYSMEPSYRKFLAQQQAADYPGMVYMAANDGMLHAFYLDDVSGTAVDEGGEEAWAWMPGYLLYREKEPSWAGRALDLMVYGRTFLFDGSPVVADVWIDHDGDGVKECTNIDAGTSTWADCEWHRVLVAQQGKGGPLTMALDITNPLSPKFLWEQYDTTDSTAPGYGLSRPVVAQIRDNEVSSDNRDRYIAIWGSGRAVPYSSSSGSFYQSAEANLYVWDVAEGPYASTDGWPTAGYSVHGDNGHPESALMTDGTDADSHYEQAYIGAALAVVDVDSDGDADTVYFPVSTTYVSSDETGGSGPDPAPGLYGSSYTSDPGSTWMYKACFDTSDPDDLTWASFFDPVADGGLDVRPEVFYAPTTSWFSDGSLGVYWGTGSPYTRSSSDNGYFFAVRDTAPGACTGFTVAPITGSSCGATGIYTLEPGEGLTGEPIVYAGAVYFSTWVPALDTSSGEVDPCEDGEGRIYGLSYADCAPAIDTNLSGDVGSGDQDYVEVDGYVSGLTVKEQGGLFYGVQNPDGGTADIGSLDTAGDPFLGTAALAWMEVF